MCSSFWRQTTGIINTMSDARYSTTVGLEMLSSLSWKKTPGMHEIKAKVDMQGDNSLATQATLYLMLQLTDGGTKPAPEGHQSMVHIEGDEITVKGEDFIGLLVTDMGVKFSGSQEYVATRQRQ